MVKSDSSGRVFVAYDDGQESWAAVNDGRWEVESESDDEDYNPRAAAKPEAPVGYSDGSYCWEQLGFGVMRCTPLSLSEQPMCPPTASIVTLRPDSNGGIGVFTGSCVKKNAMVTWLECAVSLAASNESRHTGTIEMPTDGSWLRHTNVDAAWEAYMVLITGGGKARDQRKSAFGCTYFKGFLAAFALMAISVEVPDRTNRSFMPDLVAKMHEAMKFVRSKVAPKWTCSLHGATPLLHVLEDWYLSAKDLPYCVDYCKKHAHLRELGEDSIKSLCTHFYTVPNKNIVLDGRIGLQLGADPAGCGLGSYINSCAGDSELRQNCRLEALDRTDGDEVVTSDGVAVPSMVVAAPTDAARNTARRRSESVAECIGYRISVIVRAMADVTVEPGKTVELLENYKGFF